ncbi:MAG: multiheme c-type cytochrome [Planctomycetota bacterium]|jgi:hypothetical protein
MISVSAFLALGLTSSVLALGEEMLIETGTPEQWYAGNACVQCHRENGGRLAEIVDAEWAKSIHYENNVPCQSCHGGDATLTRDEFSTDEEFRQASHLTFNAEFLFLRDRGGVGPATEGGVSYACRECHGETIERQLGDPHVRAEAPACLFSRDGGVSVSRIRGIAYVCAGCHTKAAEKHLGSPHGSFGAPSCLFCHGDGTHDIPATTIDILDARPRDQLGRCSPCHKPNTMNVIALIRKTLDKTTEQIKVSTEQFEELQRMGYRNLALGEMHGHIDNIQATLRQVLHGSNIREILELARSIEHVAKRTAYDHELVKALHDARQRQTRIAIGAAAVLLLLVGMLIFYLKTFCRPGNRNIPSEAHAS